MNWFEKFVAFLQSQMPTPGLYGWFHLLALALMLVAIVIVCKKGKNCSEKTFRKVLLVVSLVMIGLELYKQLIWSYNAVTDTWKYNWYFFPWQFCSVPMYAMLITALAKEGKFRDFMISFLATFSLFAGLVVMLYPGDVFQCMIGINIQTMVHHGSMVVIGVFMFVSGRVKMQHKTVLKGAAVFAVCVAVALVYNIAFHFIDPSVGANMFFIGPYVPCPTPVLSLFWGIVPYPVFLLIYLTGFILASYVILLIAMLIKKIVNNVNVKK